MPRKTMIKIAFASCFASFSSYRMNSNTVSARLQYTAKRCQPG
jgi:hypothetical protein